MTVGPFKPGTISRTSGHPIARHVGHQVPLAAGAQDRAAARAASSSTASRCGWLSRWADSATIEPRGGFEHGFDFAQAIHAQGRAGGDKIDDDVGDPDVRRDFRGSGDRNDLHLAAAFGEEIRGDSWKRGRDPCSRREVAHLGNPTVVARGNGQTAEAKAEIRNLPHRPPAIRARDPTRSRRHRLRRRPRILGMSCARTNSAWNSPPNDAVSARSLRACTSSPASRNRSRASSARRPLFGRAILSMRVPVVEKEKARHAMTGQQEQARDESG